jgi:hypothetical protein
MREQAIQGSETSRAALVWRARRLERFIIAWNNAQALSSIIAGLVAGSVF